MSATPFAIGLLFTVLLLGCSERNSYAVEITDASFTPGSLNVTPGTTIVWKNTGNFPKTVTAEPSPDAPPNMPMFIPDGATPLSSGTLYPGETWAYTFEAPGTYTYISRYNPLYEPNDVFIGVVEVSPEATGDTRPAASARTVPQEVPAGDSDFLIPRVQRETTPGVTQQSGPRSELGNVQPGASSLEGVPGVTGGSTPAQRMNQQTEEQLGDLSSTLNRLQNTLNRSLGE